jgi:uncharacterized membrane protein YeaQ/YmgE (transglycosylase-associated protein family)
MESSGSVLINLFSWVAFGIISGVIVELFDSYKGIKGTFFTVITAISGALLGGIMASNILNVSVGGLNFQSLIIAIAVAFLFLFLQRAFFKAD